LEGEMSNNFLRKITDYYRYGVMRNLDGAQAQTR
jgi:hypothetical protein